MNFQLAIVLATTLVLGVLVWGLILRHWKRTLDASELRERQAQVRKWSALVVFIMLAAAITYWRGLAFGWIAPGPGSALIAFSAIVCLIGAVAVRGLWYFFAPYRKLLWLNTVAYRVTLTTFIIAFVSINTLFDLRNIPAAVAFSTASNQAATNFLQVFAFLVIVVGMGEFFLQRILPNPEDEIGEAGNGSGFASSDSKALMVVPRPGSLVVSFDFPHAIRVAYAQYLFYFKQFLEDVDIEVETAISEEAGSVLFSVTPKDKNEALHKIRTALDLYLHLPTQLISDSGNESIAAQRLEATILNLKSQLKLVEAQLQAKNAALRAQDAMIKFQELRIDRILSGEILVESMKEVTPKADDPEPVIPGIVILGTYDVKGVTINLGELLRRLKKFFARNQT